MSERQIDAASIRVCQKCGNPKMTIEGVLSCVNCSTEDNNRVAPFKNEFDDPGHDATMKVLSGIKVDAPLVLSKEDSKVFVENINSADETAVKLWLKNISKFFEKRPVSDLNQAKKLIKLRKDIETLQAKIELFLNSGGN